MEGAGREHRVEGDRIAQRTRHIPLEVDRHDPSTVAEAGESTPCLLEHALRRIRGDDDGIGVAFEERLGARPVPQPRSAIIGGLASDGVIRRRSTTSEPQRS